MDILDINLAVKKAKQELLKEGRIGGAMAVPYAYSRGVGVFKANDDFGGLNAIIFPSALSMNRSTTTVILDGVKYIYDTNEFMIGNPAIAGAGDDTGEPFFIMVSPEENVTVFCTTEPGVHEYDILYTTLEEVPMSERYIPPLNKLVFHGEDGYKYEVKVNASGELVATRIQ